MTQAALKRAVELLNREYIRAYNSGQLEKVIDFFADDAVTLSPDQAPVIGRKALRRYYEDAFKRETTRSLALASLRREATGDLLCDAGQWTQPPPATGGTPAPLTGYYFSAYRRIKGEWKAVITTFNFLEAPAPDPEPAKK